jgi:F0F1-type ATP synthase membrane subunit b/b'
METLIAPFFNVIALLVVLSVLLRRPLAEFVVHRHQTVRDDLRSAQEALLAAKKGSEEVLRRLATFESEFHQLKAGAREEGAKIKSSVLASATALSRSIVSDAAATSRSLQQEFREEVRREIADRALSRAESRLRDRLTGEDRARIRSEFSSLVEKVQ